MSIGNRIKNIRIMRGLTQREVGEKAGFNVKSADIRMTQYESGARTPKEKMTKAIAEALDVDPIAVDVPNVDSYLAVMHTLFYLEDEYGLEITDVNGLPQIKIDDYLKSGLSNDFSAWLKEYEKYKNDEITKQEYDEWRYSYPKLKVERENQERQ